MYVFVPTYLRTYTPMYEIDEHTHDVPHTYLRYLSYLHTGTYATYPYIRLFLALRARRSGQPCDMTSPKPTQWQLFLVLYEQDPMTWRARAQIHDSYRMFEVPYS